MKVRSGSCKIKVAEDNSEEFINEIFCVNVKTLSKFLTLKKALSYNALALYNGG
jgi:hypothetical protein